MRVSEKKLYAQIGHGIYLNPTRDARLKNKMQRTEGRELERGAAELYNGAKHSLGERKERGEVCVGVAYPNRLCRRGFRD